MTIYEENEHLLEFSNNDNPNWERDLYEKYGFEDFKPKVFRRVNFDKHTYNVYSDKENFTDIITESLICAIKNDQINNTAYKIINTHSRLPDIIQASEMELVPDVVEEEKQDAETSSAEEIASNGEDEQNETASTEENQTATSEAEAQPVEDLAEEVKQEDSDKSEEPQETAGGE